MSPRCINEFADDDITKDINGDLCRSAGYCADRIGESRDQRNRIVQIIRDEL